MIRRTKKKRKENNRNNINTYITKIVQEDALCKTSEIKANKNVLYLF